MTQEEFDKLPVDQRQAIKALHSRVNKESGGILWDTFRDKSFLSRPGAYVGIPDVFGMFIGIEPDGFTHS